LTEIIAKFNFSKLIYFYLIKDQINPSDCVDMDCDALKKVIISDKDGTYFGSVGVAVSQSEFEWNGDRARGLGDYRIPKEALADSNGRLKNISDVYKYTGGIRDENLCTYVDDWQAYHCNSMDMKLMIIESMDADTEERRLSPVAIFSDDYKYVDLVNGPEGNFNLDFRFLK
jgi:hypothetical protein